MPPAPERPAIGTFRGDWAALADMMQESWAANSQQSLRYTENFLRSAFDYPGATTELAPAIYLGDKPAAFVAAFPRNVILNGKPVRLALNSFLTASVKVRKGGYGLMLWRALVDRAREAGYDGTINFCVDGDEMNTMMPAIARLFRLNTGNIYRIEYLSRFLRPAAGDPAANPPDAVDILLDLSRSVSAPLARTWTRAEAEWQCHARAGAITATLNEQGRRGILSGYVAEVNSGTEAARVALMEDLLWGDLDDRQRASLVGRFMQAAALRQCQAVSCPVLGYSSTEPLAAAGFRRGNRVLHTYLTLWNGQEPEVLPSMYIDVF